MKRVLRIPTAKQLLLASSLVLASTSIYAQQCQNLIWQDEFEGTTVDYTKWESMEGDGCSYGVCGWGNNELQSYSANNATVSNGILTITAKKERVKAKNYTSARLRTANMPNSGEWTNGRFEARIKIPEGQGLWPAFWMLPTNPDVGWPMSGELDILESTGQASMLAHGTIHFGNPWPENSFSGGHILSQPGKWSDNFHTYALEWTPYEMRWYLDDILFSTKTPADMADASWWTFENYQYHFLLNLAVGGTWGGTPDDSIFPVSMEVDYVRVYNIGQPAVDGPHIVAPTEVASYSVIGENGSSSSYSWSVPTGATLIGSGSSVQVDFNGASAGTVSVTVTNSCGTHELTVPVFIEPDHDVETVLDDFGGASALTYTYHDGNFNVANGTLTYTRNSQTQWDVIAADTNAIPNAGPFVTGDKAFVMDIYNTDPALVGKQILVQLENNNTATPTNFPTGRHSKYEAFISSATGWQTLRFRMADRIDGGTADTAVNSVIILIDPDAFTGDTYTIDNIAILGADGSSNTPVPVAAFTANCTDLACTFDGSGSSNAVSHQWNFGDGTSATGATASHTYVSAGDYSVILTVTDSEGATDTETQTVSVSDAGGGDQASTVVVSSVTTGTQSAGKGKKYGTATVVVTDNLGAPIAGATVNGNFSGTWNESSSAITDASGTASFITSSAVSGGATVNFCVSNVTGTTLPYDGAASSGTCQ